MEENSIQEIDVTDAEDKKIKKTLTILAVVGVILLIAVIVGVVLLSQNAAAASLVRDIFIILLALEMFVLGIAAVVLIIQLASLTNLLQNEIRPILTSTTETVNTLKGTVRFLSDNVSEPVIKMNESLASVRKLVDLFHFKK